jgi:hypothetical protein
MHTSAVYVTSEDRTHALEEGAVCYLTKPVEPRELVAQARALLRIHQGEQGAPAARQAGPDEVAAFLGLPEDNLPVLTKAEGEELLDWLEAHGYQSRMLSPEQPGVVVPQEDSLAPPEPRRCRRRHREPCPTCGSTSRPYMERELATLSWVLVGCGVLLWPLLAVGLLLRRDVWRCWDCHCVLGRGRRLTLGR